MRGAGMAGSQLLCTTNAGVEVWKSSTSGFCGAGVFPAAVASDVLICSRLEAVSERVPTGIFCA